MTPDAMRIVADETLAFTGGAVKALGGGKIGGLLVPFGSPEATDKQGDYFTAATDFGLDVTTRARVMFHHGFTKAFGSKKLGIVEYAPGADGIEVVSGVIDTDDDAVKALYEKAEAGELFWSSGSTSHMVAKRAVKADVNEVLSWPIAEVSLTPKPVDRRAKAFAVKGLLALDNPDDLLSPLGIYAPARAARMALSCLLDDAMDLILSTMTCSRPKADRLSETGEIMSAYRDVAVRVIAALMDDNIEAVKAILDDSTGLSRAVAAPGLVDRTERLVSDADVLAGLYGRASKARRAEGRTLSPAKREAVKALADSLLAVHAASVPAPDPDRLLALRRRLLASRV